MATPGYNVVGHLMTMCFRHAVRSSYSGILGPLEPEVVRRLAGYAHHRVEQGDGQYAEHFVQAVGNLLGCRIQLDEASTELMNGLLECLHRGWVADAGRGMQHGHWVHFKTGNIYQSDRIDTDTTTGEPRVSYVGITHPSPSGEGYSRTAQEWNEVVQWPDGKYRSRFMRATSRG